MAYKAELAVVRNQNIDITNFEEQMETFKKRFRARNYDLASRKFQTAIDEIDKTILHLRRPRTLSCRPRTTCAWRTTRPKILPSSA